MLIAWLWPGIKTKFARARYCVKGPHQRTGFSIKSFHSAAHTQLATGKTGDYQTVVVNRSAGDAETLGPVFGHDFPYDLTGSLVQRF